MEMNLQMQEAIAQVMGELEQRRDQTGGDG
jgi:hypothetical protein